MLQIRLNGQERSVAEETTVQDLLVELGLDRGGIAVEINRAIVPRSTHGEHCLAANDDVEIVTIMGGG